MSGYNCVHPWPSLKVTLIVWEDLNTTVTEVTDTQKPIHINCYSLQFGKKGKGEGALRGCMSLPIDSDIV